MAGLIVGHATGQGHEQHQRRRRDTKGKSPYGGESGSRHSAGTETRFLGFVHFRRPCGSKKGAARGLIRGDQPGMLKSAQFGRRRTRMVNTIDFLRENKTMGSHIGPRLLSWKARASFQMREEGAYRLIRRVNRGRHAPHRRPSLPGPRGIQPQRSGHRTCGRTRCSPVYRLLRQEQNG